MKTNRGIFLVIVSAVLFGLMPPAATLIYRNGGTPFSLAFYRFFFATPILFCIALLRKEPLSLPSRRQITHMLLIASGFVATPLLLYTSYQFIQAGMATTIHFVYPILVVILCAVLFKERMSRVQCVCCVLCTTGICCFYTPSGTINLFGVFIAFVSGLTYAVYIIALSRSAVSKMPVFQLAGWLSLLGTMLLAPIMIFTGDICPDMNIVGWGMTIAFAAVIACGAVVCFQVGTQQCGAQKASFLSTFEPLTSVIVSVLWFQEKVSVTTALGIICILLAVVFLAREEK